MLIFHIYSLYASENLPPLSYLSHMYVTYMLYAICDSTLEPERKSGRLSKSMKNHLKFTSDGSIYHSISVFYIYQLKTREKNLQNCRDCLVWIHPASEKLFPWAASWWVMFYLLCLSWVSQQSVSRGTGNIVGEQQPGTARTSSRHSEMIYLRWTRASEVS